MRYTLCEWVICLICYYFLDFFVAHRGSQSSVTKKILKVDGKCDTCDRKMPDLIVKQHLNSENSNDKPLKNTQENTNGIEALKTPAKPSVNTRIIFIRHDVLHFLFNKIYSLCSSHPKQLGRGMMCFGEISFIWVICIWPEHMDCIWQ